jgi:hypothetical protein
MKRFVRSDGGQGCICGAIGGLVVVITGSGVGVTYLIAFGLLATWIGIRLGPERVQLWREKHAEPPTRRS